jgi:hypothetical protein
VLRYYFALRSALRGRPHLRRCLVRCRHCGIFFLADPRNAGRTDLGCPFGCSEAHRKAASSARSTAYYRTKSGRQKKKALNERRKGRAPEGRRPEAAEATTSPEGESPVSGAEETGFDAVIVDHVVLVVRLVEGFAVSREEVLGMLRRPLRQHRMSGERRIDYVLRWLAEHPP